jgi:predicted aminopeptidase
MVPFCAAGDAEEIVSVPLAPVAVGAVGFVGVVGAVGVVVMSVVAGSAPSPQALNSRPRPATAAQVARWRVDFFMRNPLLIWCDSLKPPQSKIAPRVRPSPEKGGWWERARRVAGLTLLSALLTGCTSAGYYAQAVNGHLSLMAAARPVTEVIADPQTSDALRQRLAQSQDIRRFAVNELLLPDNASYHRYADLHRPSAVWSVVAAPPDALVAKTWCYPVIGCASYRGYFSEAEARAEAQALQAEGLEVIVQGVPAYSTLGWLNWAGGDPLLNTFINYPEGELARLLFHELSHQLIYVRDDSSFNEAFATAVERPGRPALAGPSRQCGRARGGRGPGGPATGLSWAGSPDTRRTGRHF